MKTNVMERDPLTPGSCEWCGKPCELEDAACSLSCEAMLHRLEATQGRLILRALKRWRKSPNHAARNAAISEIVPRIDRFLTTDRLRREELAAQRRRAEAKAKERAAEDDGKRTTRAARKTAVVVPLASAAPLTNQPESACPRCGYEFDIGSLGPHGCPNCHGEGLS